jgi:putative ABC transport system permease protein
VSVRRLPALLPAARVALQTLRTNPLRTALSTLGIVMGAAALVAVLSLGDGVERFARVQLEREGANLVQVAPRTADTIDGLRVPRTEYPVFTIADADDLAAGLDGNVDVVLSLEGTGRLAPPDGGATRAVLVTGIFTTRGGQQRPRIEAGRGLTVEEMRTGAPVVVVSRRLLAEVFPAETSASLIGRAITLEAAEWRVVGVAEPYPGERLLAAWVPAEAGERAMVPATPVRPRKLQVAVARVEEVQAARDRATRWVASRNPAWAGQVDVVSTSAQRLQTINQGILVFKLLMGAFTAIALIVGGIGIMNVLLASIIERTREIGIRRSVGARRRDLALQFLAESLAIALSGSVFGVALGLAGAFLTTAVIRARTEALVYAAVTWQSLVIAVVAAASVGVVFGLYPAWRAARLSPIEAVHHE